MRRPVPSDRRSEAQRAASRANGAKSRGPVTDDGKAKVARNALRHGLFANRHVFLDGEDQAAFDGLCDRLFGELRPADEFEAHLVRRLASVMWRLDRAESLEAALLSVSDSAAPKGLRGAMHCQRQREATLIGLLARIAPIRARNRRQAPASSASPGEPVPPGGLERPPRAGL